MKSLPNHTDIEKILNDAYDDVEKFLLCMKFFSGFCFKDESYKFKHLQTLGFRKDSDKYIQNFLNQVIYPSPLNLKKYKKDGTKEELKKLLNYAWNRKKI